MRILLPDPPSLRTINGAVHQDEGMTIEVDGEERVFVPRRAERSSPGEIVLSGDSWDENFEDERACKLILEMEGSLVRQVWYEVED